MRSYNFSKINDREKRFYSFSDVAISKSGIPTKLIIICVILLSVSVVINIPLGLVIGEWYFAPISNGAINTWGMLLVYGIPIGIGIGLYYLKVYNYRLIDLLILYFKPKHEISINGKRVVHEKVKIDAFLEKQ